MITESNAMCEFLQFAVCSESIPLWFSVSPNESLSLASVWWLINLKIMIRLVILNIRHCFFWNYCSKQSDRFTLVTYLMFLKQILFFSYWQFVIFWRDLCYEIVFKLLHTSSENITRKRQKTGDICNRFEVLCWKRIDLGKLGQSNIAEYSYTIFNSLIPALTLIREHDIIREKCKDLCNW